jgi:hypothetical protein
MSRREDVKMKKARWGWRLAKVDNKSVLGCESELSSRSSQGRAWDDVARLWQ